MLFYKPLQRHVYLLLHRDKVSAQLLRIPERRIFQQFDSFRPYEGERQLQMPPPNILNGTTIGDGVPCTYTPNLYNIQRTTTLSESRFLQGSGIPKTENRSYLFLFAFSTVVSKKSQVKLVAAILG
jgi:hypothetical protein